MSLTPGARLGPYEIVALIGAGGMGEVYRARDTNLNRDVAVKVLLDAVAGDPERVARFTREAHVLASLNHPNIAHLYGFEAGSKTSFLVMELVEGPTLADLVAASPSGLPLEQTLPIARQIAEALEAAHEQGVVHRDLKPANVKVRDDGVVKVLDFGLAKAFDPAATSGAVAQGFSPVSPEHSPTLTARATHMGMILGTAAYMAPEQARGKAVDKRADVWAFGAVLFEMLTGARAFKGDDISDTLAAVLRQEIPLAELPPTAPARLVRLVGRCLERDPKQRLRDIGEARIELARLEAGGPDVLEATGAASGRPGTDSPALSAPSHRRERIAWSAAVGLLTLAVVGAGAWGLLRQPQAPLETRLEITTPPTTDLLSFAISPDGRQMVFVAAGTGGTSQLWLRPVDQPAPQPLAGTEGAMFPFWSPDSRSVAFFAGSQLRRLDLGSRLPQTIGSVSNGARGGSWNGDDVIVFGETAGPLYRITATVGAQAATVTTLPPGQASHRFPHFLPGGRQFLFYAMGTSSGLYLGSLDSPRIKRVADADTSAEFVQPNWLLFLRQARLLAQHVDLARGELTGDPVSLADQVAFSPTFSAGAFSAAPTGLITYRAGASAITQLTWFDRAGKAVGTIGQPDASGLLCPTLSPTDGHRVVAYRTVQGNIDLWLFDAGRLTKLTFDAGRDEYPAWSPDGSRILFAKDTGDGVLGLYQMPSSGGGAEEPLLKVPGHTLTPQSWSRDGKSILYLDRDPKTGGDLWVLPLEKGQKPYEFLKTRFEERAAQFSPDGRWVAYSSDESGQMEIYVRPFPKKPGQSQVSTTGGVTPRWARNGKELYYIAPDGMLMAVPVHPTPTSPGLGTPQALFLTRAVFGGASIVGITWQYDVAEDGRFLINATTVDGRTAPITVIQNWAAKR